MAGISQPSIMFSDQKFGIVILCNLDTFNPLNLARKIADIYLADVLAPEAPAPDTQPRERTETEPLSPEQLSEYEGDYYTKNSIPPIPLVCEATGSWRNTDVMTTYR